MDRRNFLGAVAGVAGAAVLPPVAPQLTLMGIPLVYNNAWPDTTYTIYCSRGVYDMLTKMACEPCDPSASEAASDPPHQA